MSSSPLTQDISGQCIVCGDLFTVTMEFPHGNSLPQVQQTPRLSVKGAGTDTELIHRAGVCDGKVILYGNPEFFKIWQRQQASSDELCRSDAAPFDF